MAVFKDAEALYAVMRDLFEEVARTAPKAFDELIRARLTVRFRVNNPTGEITIDGKTRPMRMTYGVFGGRPDMDLDLTGDNLDRLLRHDISATKAVTDGTIKFKGNPLKLKALLAVIKVASAIYPNVRARHEV
jgi:alkyl sulfatase BDS1-like metallo-beta-lactamase superfamily hydrolase